MKCQVVIMLIFLCLMTVAECKKSKDYSTGIGKCSDLGLVSTSQFDLNFKTIDLEKWSKNNQAKLGVFWKWYSCVPGSH